MKSKYLKGQSANSSEHLFRKAEYSLGLNLLLSSGKSLNLFVKKNLTRNYSTVPLRLKMNVKEEHDFKVIDE